MPDEKKLERLVREMSGAEEALDAELDDLKEKNARLLRLIVGLLVLKGNKINDEIYTFTFPRQAIDRIPIKDFVLDHKEEHNTITLTMRPRRGGTEML